jgi:hypothetical protein
MPAKAGIQENIENTGFRPPAYYLPGHALKDAGMTGNYKSTINQSFLRIRFQQKRKSEPLLFNQIKTTL